MNSFDLIFDNQGNLDEGKFGISLVIFTYNQENFISDAIQSVFDQLCENDELLIIDDYSQDRTINVIMDILSPKQDIPFSCKVYTKYKNYGVNHSTNFAFEIAKNEYIVPLAGDDLYRSGAIDRIKEIIPENGYISAAFASCDVVDEKLNIIGQTTYEDSFEVKNLIHYMKTGRFDLAGHSQVLWNTKLIKQFGPLPLDITNEDDQLILRSVILGNVMNFREKLRVYRRNSGSMSFANSNLFVDRKEYFLGQHTPLLNRAKNYEHFKNTMENLQQSNHSDSLVNSLGAIENSNRNLSIFLYFLMSKRRFIALATIRKVINLKPGYAYFREALIFIISPDIFIAIKRILYRLKYRVSK